MADNSWSYIWGQCTYYVAKTLDWIPSGLGNANEWLGNAQAKGLQTSQQAAPGEVVVYNGPGYSEFGHVGVVGNIYPDNTFDVSEMNYKGVGVTDTRRSTYNGVAGFIVPPGGVSASRPAGAGSATDPISYVGEQIGNVPKAIGAMVHNAEEAMLTFSLGVGLFVLALILILVGLYVISRGGDDEGGGTKIVPIPV